jgi:hypothetical protein
MVYHNLTIKAVDAATDIWLADDEGNLVQKEIGEMKTRILPGTYFVHFGLKSKGIKIDLQKDEEINQGRGT